MRSPDAVQARHYQRRAVAAPHHPHPPLPLWHGRGDLTIHRRLHLSSSLHRTSIASAYLQERHCRRRQMVHRRISLVTRRRWRRLADACVVRRGGSRRRSIASRSRRRTRSSHHRLLTLMMLTLPTPRPRVRTLHGTMLIARVAPSARSPTAACSISHKAVLYSRRRAYGRSTYPAGRRSMPSMRVSEERRRPRRPPRHRHYRCVGSSRSRCVQEARSRPL